MQLNPIIEKDMKTKMRGWRMPVLLSLYLVFLGLVLFLFFASNNQMLGGYSYYAFNPRIAVNAYNLIAFFEFTLLLFIVPALTATSISGERERQTLDLMLCSGISTFSIVTGKLVVSLAHVLLLVAASLPILGMVLLFGGITFGEMLFLLLFYVITAVMVASIGIFFSVLFRKSVLSVIATYIIIGALVLAPIIIYAFYMTFGIRPGSASLVYSSMSAILFPSPAFGFTSFVSGGQGGIFIFDLFSEVQRIFLREKSWLKYVQPWMINSLFNLALSFVLIVISAWKLNPVKRRRSKRKISKTGAVEGKAG